MSRDIHQKLSVAFTLLLLLFSAPALGASFCAPDGLQASGSIYRICMPPADVYNGKLVVFAHGFQDANTPVRIPEEQLQIGDQSLPELVNGLGYGFATNSFSKTGLAVRQGAEDILDLVKLFAAEQGTPSQIFLTGASEGGVITALLTEQHPQIFNGGMALCGPVGDFPFQMTYFGDARVTFEYFFPGLIPGDPFHPSQDLIDNWSEYYALAVEPVIFAPENKNRLDQWVKVARLPFDANDYINTLRVSANDVLNYAVVNLNDASATLGGFPFDNQSRWYTGSNNDLLLNLLVMRAAADPAAIQEMKTFYNTSGALSVPLITMHTTLDQQIPYVHENIYSLKTILTGSFLTRHLNIPIDRFEHCNFTTGELLFAFGMLLQYVGTSEPLQDVGSILQGEALSTFSTLADKYGLNYRMD